jgi:tripartite-type tricarboxylate transporter receptor subunit TctC
MISTSESAMLPFLKKSYRYDPTEDFTPIALVANSWTVFAVHSQVPANTLPELIRYAKANPGKLRYLMSRVFSPYQFNPCNYNP